MVELVDGSHESDIALLDEIQKCHATVAVVLGDGDDQTQVGFDQLILCPSRLGLADGHTLARRLEIREA